MTKLPIPPTNRVVVVADLTLSRDDEETLVADGRTAVSPSQQVEQKLIGMLRASPLLMSQTQRQLRPSPR